MTRPQQQLQATCARSPVYHISDHGSFNGIVVVGGRKALRFQELYKARSREVLEPFEFVFLELHLPPFVVYQCDRRNALLRWSTGWRMDSALTFDAITHQLVLSVTK
jgi:hypothetical protein